MCFNFLKKSLNKKLTRLFLKTLFLFYKYLTNKNHLPQSLMVLSQEPLARILLESNATDQTQLP